MALPGICARGTCLSEKSAPGWLRPRQIAPCGERRRGVSWGHGIGRELLRMDTVLLSRLQFAWTIGYHNRCSDGPR
ncbi:MAG: hypothetical protein ACLQJR_14815 [Stellaceae bacterium]